MHGNDDAEKDEEEAAPTPETTEMARILELSPGTVRKMKSSGALRADEPDRDNDESE